MPGSSKGWLLPSWATVAGLVAWVIMFFLPIKPVFGVPLVEWLVLGGPLVVAPLALAALPNKTWGCGVLRPLQVPTALLFAGSVLDHAGNGSLALTLPWLLWCAASAGCAVLRVYRRPPLPETALDLGFIYLFVGAIWWSASRGQFALMGFDPVIVTLTAAHFQFAGLATCTITARIGWLLEQGGRWRKLYVASALIIMGTPIIVALGITGSHLVEVVSSFILAIGVVCMALLGMVVAKSSWRAHPIYAGVLALASCISLGTMTLAVLYAMGGLLNLPAISISTMARYHGPLNVLGFTIPVLFALAGLESSRAQSVAGERIEAP